MSSSGIISTDEIINNPPIVREGIWGDKKYNYGGAKGEDYELPTKYNWVGFYANKVQVEAENNRSNGEFIPPIFHGTRLSKLKEILASNGMIAFKENEEEGIANPIGPRIYATANPAMAVNHAYYNGPHDTFKDKKVEGDDEDPVVLLKIDPTKTGRPLDKLRENIYKEVDKYKQELPLMYIGIILGQKIPLEAITVVTSADNYGNIKENSVPKYLELLSNNPRTE